MIINLTQHVASQEQIAAGVIDVAAEQRQDLAKLLTFVTLPTKEEIETRALQVAALARLHGAEVAMIGGAPFFMGALEGALKTMGVRPLYAFSERVSQEVTKDDGSVHKVNVFKHLGFVEV